MSRCQRERAGDTSWALGVQSIPPKLPRAPLPPSMSITDGLICFTQGGEKRRGKRFPILCSRHPHVTISRRCKVSRADKSPLGDTIWLRAQDLSSTSSLSPSSGPGGSKSCVESFGDGDAPPSHGALPFVWSPPPHQTTQHP